MRFVSTVVAAFVTITIHTSSANEWNSWGSWGGGGKPTDKPTKRPSSNTWDSSPWSNNGPTNWVWNGWGSNEVANSAWTGDGWNWNWNGKQTPPTGSPTVTSAPTFVCNLTQEERAAQIRQHLLAISNSSLLDNTTTPQGRALQWITYDDNIKPPICPNPVNHPLIQRYVLAVFYFSTVGDDWNFCAAPDDLNDPAKVAAANDNCFHGDAWMTAVNECEWGGSGNGPGLTSGVSCSDAERIEELNLSKS